MTAVCEFAAKIPGQHVILPYAIRAVLMRVEIFSELNRWGAAKRFHHSDPTPKELTEYYVLISAEDPDNPAHESGAEQFAEFFAAAETAEEERRVIESFMINM